MLMNTILTPPTIDHLARFGLTTDIIARHCFVVAPTRVKHAWGWRHAQTELRARRKAAGLNVLTGEPLKRSPNGTRKPRVRRGKP